jgi:glycolate oxidase iron-sulfur subunit
MHLVDHAREHIEKTYRRPLLDRLLRATLARVLPYPARMRAALRAGLLARPFAPLFARANLAPIAAMLRLIPSRLPEPAKTNGQRRVWPAHGVRNGRVALFSACANQVLAPAIDRAAINVLTRHGIEVVAPANQGCCGALVHHLGRKDDALGQVRAVIDALTREIENGSLDAIVVTASGCGTMLKDYGFLLRNDAVYAAKAAIVSALAKDISEYLNTLSLAPTQDVGGMVVAYHSACSLQHGQKIVGEPKELLTKVGCMVKDVPEAHLCCGSAGTYNILQPEIAGRLRDRKIRNIATLQPDVIAAGNIGCITQLAAATAIPILHPVELVDWATGGPKPEALQGRPVTAGEDFASPSLLHMGDPRQVR